MNKNLPRLIILSDLWGNSNTIWSQNLIPYFNIAYYDSRQLARLPSDLNSEKEIHQYFIQTGIYLAVQNICTIEKEPVHILGFSIGGLIAWKAALLGLKADRLFCISSTRLRFENLKPPTSIFLYFGANDENNPSDDWFDHHKIAPHLEPHQNHSVYLNQKFLDFLLNQMSILKHP